MAIYESPNGGKTVYMREPGENERRLIRSGLYEEWNGFAMQYDWDGLAEKYPAIQEKLEELKVITRLCNENKS